MKKENAKFWHATDFKDMELLKARYITHTYPRHIHSEYAIGVRAWRFLQKTPYIRR
ncbi:hypothetical protein QUF76_08495 [Desulfobacterales bacterium HSG16]|nr:hypothetical protein [Desulfobacterales bacterium HSG16]